MFSVPSLKFITAIQWNNWQRCANKISASIRRKLLSSSENFVIRIILPRSMLMRISKQTSTNLNERHCDEWFVVCGSDKIRDFPLIWNYQNQDFIVAVLPGVH